MEELNMDLTYTELMRMINAFKKHAILWNPHMLGYHNRENKEEAWKIVAAESGIDPEVCKRKMKSLMSSCRREKIKIIKSRRSGNPDDVHEPKWRYWNAFKFLRGLDDDDEDPLGTAPEMDILDPTCSPTWLKTKMISKRKALKTAAAAAAQPKPVTVPIPPITSGQPVPSDECHSIGVTVSSKLRKMYHDQRLYAENLINQALYKGLLFQLTPQSEIKTPNFQGQVTGGPDVAQGAKRVAPEDPFAEKSNSSTSCQNSSISQSPGKAKRRKESRPLTIDSRSQSPDDFKHIVTL